MPSLCTGVVPAAFKIAVVTPTSLLPLISNLPFLANNLFEPLQSGFRKFHSVETALVKVTNDLLIASDSGCLSILILLDLSERANHFNLEINKRFAIKIDYDTVDHSLLIARLETVFWGVSGTVYNWFKSYLTDHISSLLLWVELSQRSVF